jgi:mRNA interferase HicA
VNSSQFKRWLARQGCTFEPAKGGHVWVKLNGRKTILPMHGGSKQLGTGLINAIKKDLGLR